MSIRPNFMLLGGAVGKEIAFLQRPSEADDEGGPMAIDDGDGIIKKKFF